MKKIKILTAAVMLIMTAVLPVFAGTWEMSGTVWKYKNDNGAYSANTWQWIDGKCYCFDGNGAMYAGTTTPDGYTVNADGAWTVNGVVQKKTAAASGSGDRLVYFNKKYGFNEDSPEYLKKWNKTFVNTRTCAELKSFLTSIDWPNMSEMDRLEACFKRCATGYNGNYYSFNSFGDQENIVLVHKTGICADYAATLEDLCRMVGLETCQDLRPSHVLTRVKLNGVWYVVDPTWAYGQPMSSVLYRLDDPVVDAIYGKSEGTKQS